MGVELAFEVLQLGLCAAVLQLPAGRLGAVPSAGHADGDADPDHQHIEQDVARKEPHGVLPRARHGRPRHVGRKHEAEEQVHPEHDCRNQHEVAAHEATDAVGEQVAAYQHEIVGVEDHHERERHEQEAGVLRPVHQGAVGTGHEQRHTQHDGPGREVDQPPRIFRLRSVHT
jgi:hypothetical protein